MKEFNYTGTCIPELHYMVDTSDKINQIKNLVDRNKYFTINRPRQYGKTTTIFLLEENLQENYILISISFEGLGEAIFESEEKFCKAFLSQMSENLLNDEEVKKFIISKTDNCSTLLELSKVISEIVKNSDKKLVLLIDEVDKASNHVLFLNFLGMLRSKYLMAQRRRDNTFHSVILAGVHDIKNIKMKITGQTEMQYNSPWNIAADFNVEMSFNAAEIKTMLDQYEADKDTGMDKEAMSKQLYDYTSGYPYLVSKLCYIIDEDINADFTEEGLEKAVKLILKENNTLFDDLLKNINTYEEVYELVERLILDGEEILYNPDAYALSMMFGITKEDSFGKLKLHNKIFEIRLYNYLIEMRGIKGKEKALKYKYEGKFIDENGDLNMELVLEKFQELMKAEYREVDEKFVEREGRLLFLAFLKPIINGTGFYFVEAETRKSNRMDIVVTYNKKKYVVELKIWRGGKYEQEGKEQLCEYLEAQNLDKGYMIFYNFNKNKEYVIDKSSVKEKEIFEVIV